MVEGGFLDHVTKHLALPRQKYSRCLGHAAVALYVYSRSWNESYINIQCLYSYPGQSPVITNYRAIATYIVINLKNRSFAKSYWHDIVNRGLSDRALPHIITTSLGETETHGRNPPRNQARLTVRLKNPLSPRHGIYRYGSIYKLL